jgi:hypothetical protein
LHADHRYYDPVGLPLPSARFQSPLGPVRRTTPARVVLGGPIIRPATAGAVGVGGARTARANWTPPVSNGGLAINGYVVTAFRINAA